MHQHQPDAHRRLLLSCVLLCFFAAIPCSLAAEQENRPNIVVVLCDDLGYGDLACYGDKELKTPHVDRFAREGVRFTNCYAAAANCSPSRTGLMTGRTPYRAGIHNWIADGSPMHLKRSEITIATLLKNAGYATCHSGKWHLNGRFNQPEKDGTGQPQPGDHGFEHWFSTQNNAGPSHRRPRNFVRNGEAVGQIEGYSAGIVADEAIRWLSDTRDKSKPFFLYVCFHEPHEPIATAKEFTDLYEYNDPKKTAHHGNISQMDAAFGRLMQALDDAGLRESTFVLFTSDNGPAITTQHPHGSAGPLRDKKGFLHEGGIRVPGIARFPGVAKAGTECDEPICGVDFLPTACELAGIEPPQDRALDGASILPALKGEPIERGTPLYWHFNVALGGPKVALRFGNWKILATLSGPNLGPNGAVTEEQQESIKTAKLKAFELYNLKEDVGETNNLAEKEPDRLAEMKAQLEKKYGEVQKESPTWPAWKPGE